jgi:hypothetical protein
MACYATDARDDGKLINGNEVAAADYGGNPQDNELQPGAQFDDAVSCMWRRKRNTSTTRSNANSVRFLSPHHTSIMYSKTGTLK